MVTALSQAADTRAALAGPLLDVRSLTTTITLRHAVVRPVDDVSFSVLPGEVFGLVGESGSGKTITALSIMRLIARPLRISAGRVLLAGQDLLALPESRMRQVRGQEVSMVFQEPMTSLDPSFTIGRQITETIHAHRKVSAEEARRRAVDLLERVGIPQPASRLHSYPHQFSGGMRQRVMIAIALALEPRLLIADEPTTALDVTLQAQILDLILSLQRESGLSMLLITHDLGVIAEVASRVAVMYAGEIVEAGPVRALFNSPRHPYTRGLLDSVASRGADEGSLKVIPGRVPELTHLPPGCRFAPRCANALDRCWQEHPLLAPDGPQRELRCFNPVAPAPLSGQHRSEP
ncbi:MAG TPA: ABC transporter ATP-binding protein [Chloroflexota bacterium]|nr:ABC transporter ATP-binding protein [Chloroflexota bacterium]